MSDQATLSPIDEFKTRIRGSVLTADDSDYDAARAVQNGLIDRKPALIVRWARPTDGSTGCCK